MPNLIGIYDGGSKVVEVNGHPVNVGVLIFRASENESAPVDYIAHYRLHYREPENSRTNLTAGEHDR